MALVVNEMSEKFFLNGRYVSSEEVLEYFRTRPPRRRDQIASMLVNRHPVIKKLVDVGCFEGSFSEHLRVTAPQLETLALDYFEENIKIAKFLFPHLSTTFRCNSVYALEIPDKTIDCVTIKEVVEHLDRPVDAIREINRVLVPGGYLFVSTPNAASRPGLSMLNSLRGHLHNFVGKTKKIMPAIFHEKVEFSRHIYSWNLKTLFTLLYINGFEMVEYGFIGGGITSFLLPEFGDELYIWAKKTHDSPSEII